MPTYPFKKRDTMRRFRLFLFAVLLMLTASVQAQTLRDSSNRNIGKVESDGTIRDGSNRMVGRIYTDGTMRDSSNRNIGKIESDGTVRDGMNRYLGKVESDGTIRNSSNSCIGHARGISHRQAAAFFFFNMF